MNDLISRKVVMKFLSEKNKNGMPESSNGKAVYCFVENLIDEIRDDIPTAYNVDKVIVQLYDKGVCAGNNKNGFILLSKAVEIVKGAVKDE